jgi:hypothetical protein
VEPLIRSGKSSVLYLLTREAADEEKRIIEKELAQWKDRAKDKDDIIDQNEGKIKELQQTGKPYDFFDGKHEMTNLRPSQPAISASNSKRKLRETKFSQMLPAGPQCLLKVTLTVQYWGATVPNMPKSSSFTKT